MKNLILIIIVLMWITGFIGVFFTKVAADFSLLAKVLGLLVWTGMTALLFFNVKSYYK